MTCCICHFHHCPDVFANSKSLESTAVHEFISFTTKIISPEKNFTSGMGRISFYYYLWIADDPEGNEDTYPSLNVVGCDGALMWTKMTFTAGWRFAEIDFPCPTAGKVSCYFLSSLWLKLINVTKGMLFFKAWFLWNNVHRIYIDVSVFW